MRGTGRICRIQRTSQRSLNLEDCVDEILSLVAIRLTESVEDKSGKGGCSGDGDEMITLPLGLVCAELLTSH